MSAVVRSPVAPLPAAQDAPRPPQGPHASGRVAAGPHNAGLRSAALPYGGPRGAGAARERAFVIGAVLAAHLVVLGFLLARTALPARKPLPLLTFAYLAPPETERPKEPPKPPAPRPRPPAARPAAPIAVPVEVTAPVPTVAAPVVETAPAPVAPSAAPTSSVVAAPAPPAPAPPPPPRVLPASAIAYLVPPPIEVPLASRRLGETGTVLLRVRVGRDGLPQQIALHRSSGFERLDRQALEAMRHARFKPQTEDGQAIEWIVIAPFEYALD